MDRVGLVFLLCLALCVVVSLAGKAESNNESVDLSEVNFDTTKGFNIATVGIVIILVALYAAWW